MRHPVALGVVGRRPGTSSASTHSRLTGWRAWAIWSVVAIDLAWMATATIVLPEQPDFPRLGLVVFSLMVGSLGLVGALVMTRQPRNPIGWILWVAATMVTLSTVGDFAVLAIDDAVWATAGATLLAWLSQLMLIPAMAGVIILVPLLFPDGRLLSPRWRWVVVLAIVSISVSVIPDAFGPGPMAEYPTLDNPFGIEAAAGLSGIADAANALSVVLFPMAVSSAVIRYRRGSQVEREQLKWFAAAVGLTVSAFGLALIPVAPLGEISWILGIASISFIPVAIGIAILRYRLYEIDRLISRTISYVVITGLLLVAYGTLTVLLADPLSALTGGGTLPVAISTLAVAALFQPVRLRVQRVVDRRFDRARYDGAIASETFADHLRHDVDLASLTAELGAVVGETVAPRTQSVWLRHP